jgi:hypothetical protein
LFCDETPMPVLDPRRHRTRICQFWAHAMDDRPWGGPSPPAVARVSERMCKQVSVSLPYRGDSHDEQLYDYTGIAGSTSC